MELKGDSPSKLKEGLLLELKEDLPAYPYVPLVVDVEDTHGDLSAHGAIGGFSAEDTKITQQYKLQKQHKQGNREKKFH